MWLDRLTGEQLRQLPGEVDPGRYCTEVTGLAFNGHTPDFSGLLVDDGSQRCQHRCCRIFSEGNELLRRAFSAARSTAELCLPQPNP